METIKFSRKEAFKQMEEIETFKKDSEKLEEERRRKREEGDSDIPKGARGFVLRARYYDHREENFFFVYFNVNEEKFELTNNWKQPQYWARTQKSLTEYVDNNKEKVKQELEELAGDRTDDSLMEFLRIYRIDDLDGLVSPRKVFIPTFEDYDCYSIIAEIMRDNVRRFAVWNTQTKKYTIVSTNTMVNRSNMHIFDSFASAEAFYKKHKLSLSGKGYHRDKSCQAVYRLGIIGFARSSSSKKVKWLEKVDEKD